MVQFITSWETGPVTSEVTSIPVPAEAQPGDLMLISLTAFTGTPAPTMPADAYLIGEEGTYGNQGFGTTDYYYRTVAPGEPGANLSVSAMPFQDFGGGLVGVFIFRNAKFSRFTYANYGGGMWQPVVLDNPANDAVLLHAQYRSDFDLSGHSQGFPTGYTRIHQGYSPGTDDILVGLGYAAGFASSPQPSEPVDPTTYLSPSLPTYSSSYAAAVIALAQVNQPPHAPTLTFPVNTAIPTTQTNRFTVTFNDPDPGDSMSALRMWARPAGTTTWTVDTGWVTTPSPFRDFPAGTFTVGEWEWQAATKDAQGVEGPASASAFFTAAVPPPAPTITDPANNGTIPTSTYTVVWSTPDQDAYQVQVLNGETVVDDTGVVESPTARSRALDFPDNQVGRTIRVRVRDGGLWSEWSTVTVTVSYSPPATPVLSVGPYRPGEVDGLRVQVTHPAPAADQPTVTSHDVYVREVGDTGPGIRIGADLPATMAWEPGPGRPWLPASGTDYEFRALARADSGTSSWSAWTA